MFNANYNVLGETPMAIKCSLTDKRLRKNTGAYCPRAGTQVLS